MAVKKPIVLYGGLMKQLQPGDVTPGQHDASEARSIALLSASNLQTNLDNLSEASSMCCESGRSVALRAESWAEAAESIARSLDLTGTASEAYSLGQRAQSLGQWAENRASNALSMAKEAVEISDISEAVSIGKAGVVLATLVSEASSECCLLNALATSEARSLALNASIAAGGGLTEYSEADSAAARAYSIADSTAQRGYSTAVDVLTTGAQSTGVRGESIGRRARSLASAVSSAVGPGLDAYSEADSAAQRAYSVAVSGVTAAAQSTGVRGESLARAAKSTAFVYTDDAIDGLSIAVGGDINTLSEAVGMDITDLSNAIVGGFGGYSEADSTAQRAYSVAVGGMFDVVDSSIAHVHSMAVGNQGRASEATSIGRGAESLARLAQEAEIEYSIDFGMGREGRFVYMTNVANTVGLARADDEARMPAFGVITADNESVVRVRKLSDKIAGIKVDSSANPIVGSNLFISSLESGKVTNIPPVSGVNQRIGSANLAPSSANIELNMKIGEAVIL